MGVGGEIDGGRESLLSVLNEDKGQHGCGCVCVGDWINGWYRGRGCDG